MKRLLAIIFAVCIVMGIASCTRDMPVDTPPAETLPTEILTPAPPEPIQFTPPDETDESNNDEYPDVPVAIDAPFPGRIAIVTNAVHRWRDEPSRSADGEDHFRSAEAIVKRYGSDRVIHRTWPDNYVLFYPAIDDEVMIRILTELAEDPEIGAIIINTPSSATLNTLAAIDAVREIRGDDIFIAVASSVEDPRDVSARVNLALNVNAHALGSQFVAQAHRNGRGSNRTYLICEA